jgi:glucose-6-phosphate-specific signal transduction histidine kinase
MLVVVDQESLQLVVSLVIILMAQQFIEHISLHHQVLLVSVPLLALVLLSILWLLVGVELVEVMDITHTEAVVVAPVDYYPIIQVYLHH